MDFIRFFEKRIDKYKTVCYTDTCIFTGKGGNPMGIFSKLFGQAAHFHKNVRKYLENVKAVSKIPVMMGFGIRTAEDVAGLKDTIDGCIVGTHFIELMEENNYDLDVAKEYIRKFKKELNA